MKQVIDRNHRPSARRERQVAKVYQLKHATTRTAEFMLEGLFPNARFARTTRPIAGRHRTAPRTSGNRESDCRADIPGQQTQQTTEIYRFDRTSADSAEDAFQRLAPRARVSSIRGTNSVLATATESEHALFREAAEKINGGGGESIVRATRSTKNRLTSRTCSRRSMTRSRHAWPSA